MSRSASFCPCLLQILDVRQQQLTDRVPTTARQMFEHESMIRLVLNMPITQYQLTSAPVFYSFFTRASSS